MLSRALSEADGDVQLTLADESLLQGLFHGRDFLHPAYQEKATRVVTSLRRYLAVLAAAHYHESRLGSIRGDLAAMPLLSKEDVAALFKAGHDGSDALGLPVQTRAQLLLYQLERIEGFRAVVRDLSHLVAGEILAGGRPAYTLPEWVRIIDTVGSNAEEPARVRLPDGTSVRVTSVQVDQDLRITVMTTAGREPLPDDWVSGALAVMFSLARPVVAAMPEIERFHVIWLSPRGVDQGPNEERLVLSLTRHAIDNLDWLRIEAVKRYSVAHLEWVPDHRVE